MITISLIRNLHGLFCVFWLSVAEMWTARRVTAALNREYLCPQWTHQTDTRERYHWMGWCFKTVLQENCLKLSVRLLSGWKKARDHSVLYKTLFSSFISSSSPVKINQCWLCCEVNVQSEDTLKGSLIIKVQLMTSHLSAQKYIRTHTIQSPSLGQQTAAVIFLEIKPQYQRQNYWIYYI